MNNKMTKYKILMKTKNRIYKNKVRKVKNKKNRKII